MRLTLILVTVGLLTASSVLSQTRESNPREQEIVNSYLKKSVSQHNSKLSWFSANFGLNRIFRDNDYNKFVDNQRATFSNGRFGYLNMASSIGLEAAVVFKEKFAWTIGGELWLKMGETLEGSYSYNVPGGSGPSTVTNPKSEISVTGFSSGLQYFILNPPKLGESLSKMAVRIGGTVGLYQVNWELWQQYQNLNLATSNSAATNTTFKDNTVGFGLNLGLDYPINFGGLIVAADLNYLHLNFDNVAWYNLQNEEIIASLNGQEDGRVDLNLSGGRGKIELKKFFSW
ncbi:MAG: hypothetical protein SGI97_04030 [candidate division Zixibacteria bacterium]|nr:hypothetical protein [candidate division Zixibacteria bacterium]